MPFNTRYYGKYEEEKYSCKDDCCSYKYDKCEIDCDEVLEKSHELFYEAECKFNEAQRLFNEVLVRKIYEALDIMRRVGAAEDDGVALQEEGNALIENSGCDFKSCKDDPRCKAIMAAAIEEFIKEQEAQDEVVRLLKEVLEQIKIGAAADARGDKLVEEYKECIHCCDPCKRDGRGWF